MDSPLEESGFELVVPPSFLSWPGRQRDHLDQRRGACPFSKGDRRFESRLLLRRVHISSGQRGCAPCVGFMVFDWKSDRNEDVWEFERRINLEESREWPGRQMKRAGTAHRHGGAL